MKADEIITEARGGVYQYLKNIVPTWPDYIVKDWLYSNYARGDLQSKERVWNFKQVKSEVLQSIKDANLDVNTKWQLNPNMQFTMDMWEPDTKRKIEERAGGTKNPYGIDRDAERHATQADLAKKQGGIRKEPVIIIQKNDGYELLEGWHRTIQHFNMYPEGYVGPAWVAKANR